MHSIAILSGCAIFTSALSFIAIVEASSFVNVSRGRKSRIEELLLILLFSIIVSLLFRSIPAFPLSVLFLSLFAYAIKKRRKILFLKRLNRELSFVSLSLSLLIEAGCSIQSAVARLYESYPIGPSKIFLEDVRGIFDMGIDIEKVKGDISRIYRSEYADLFLEILITGKKLGSGPGNALKQLSDKMIGERVLKGEENSLKAPVKLMVPLCLFIFPAIFLLIFSPVILQIGEMFR